MPKTGGFYKKLSRTGEVKLGGLKSVVKVRPHMYKNTGFEMEFSKLR